MKKILLFSFFLITLSALRLNAQQLNVVSEPGPGYNNVTQGIPYFGYEGYPTVYNNNLYIYYDSVSSDLESSSDAPVFLAKYNGSGLTFFKNPDKGKGFVYINPDNNPQYLIDEYKPVVFNGKLFLPYNDSTNATCLAIFDGTSLKLAVNPDNSMYGYQGFATVYNNNLYFLYVGSTGLGQLAMYDAGSNSIKLIANPDNSPYGCEGDPVIFNNKIYLKYSVAGTGAWHISSYDGSNWKIYDNPDASNAGYQGNETEIVWNNNLYAQYYDAQNHNRLMKFDGTNTPTLIAEPGTDNTNGNNTGYTAFPIIYQNNLYFQYYNHSNSGNFNLAMCNGASITVIPNVKASDHGFWNTPVVYDNQICFFYNDSSNVHQLAKYNGTTLSLVPNADNSAYGCWSYPIVYGENLFFQYKPAQGYQLGYYDNNKMYLIADPNSNAGTSIYDGWPPIVFNNLLFMMYLNIQYGNFANLVYLDQNSLPVTFLGFTATVKDNAGMLNWTVADEINNKGFYIERSTNNLNFNTVAYVAAKAGNGTTTYNYTDKNIVSGSDYYRIKQVDADGSYRYSEIRKIDYSKFVWKITGNPGNNTTVEIMLDRQANVNIQILSNNGNIIKTIQKENLDIGNYTIPLNINNISTGIYYIKLLVNNQVYTAKLVK